MQRNNVLLAYFCHTLRKVEHHRSGKLNKLLRLFAFVSAADINVAERIGNVMLHSAVYADARDYTRAYGEMVLIVAQQTVREHTLTLVVMRLDLRDIYPHLFNISVLYVVVSREFAPYFGSFEVLLGLDVKTVVKFSVCVHTVTARYSFIIFLLLLYHILNKNTIKTIENCFFQTYNYNNKTAAQRFPAG